MFRNLKIGEKWTSQISVRAFVENFTQIYPSVWGVALSHTDTHTHIHTYSRVHTHTHRHTHTQTHTHTLGSIATYSVKMTEYKKEEATKKARSEIRGHLGDFPA